MYLATFTLKNFATFVSWLAHVLRRGRRAATQVVVTQDPRDLLIDIPIVVRLFPGDGVVDVDAPTDIIVELLSPGGCEVPIDARDAVWKSGMTRNRGGGRKPPLSGHWSIT